jgi:Domain of unknown function (DUF4864)
MMHAMGRPARRRLFLAVVAGLLLAPPGPVAGQPSATEQQAAAMQQTVLDQLAAFRRGDWAAAYAFASEMIQGQFTLDTFREMVSRGYAPIAQSAAATVLGTEVVGAGRGYVAVRVQGQNGQTVDALYDLVEEHGAWRINGVVTRPAERGELTRA